MSGAVSVACEPAEAELEAERARLEYHLGEVDASRARLAELEARLSAMARRAGLAASRRRASAGGLRVRGLLGPGREGG